MNIVVTSATAFEHRLIEENLNKTLLGTDNNLSVSFHTSGVGLLASTHSLTALMHNVKPGLVIQAGIAGSFAEDIQLGDCVAVGRDYLGDTGVDEEGRFIDIFDMKLADENAFPFQQKALENPWLHKFSFLKMPVVNSVTVNKISTSEATISQLRSKYSPSIESMEGAALHYAALMANVPFIQIRSVSNLVGQRDKSKWKIQEALGSLANAVVAFIEAVADNNILQKQ